MTVRIVTDFLSGPQSITNNAERNVAGVDVYERLSVERRGYEEGRMHANPRQVKKDKSSEVGNDEDVRIVCCVLFLLLLLLHDDELAVVLASNL